MSKYTLADFALMTLTQRKAINKSELLNLLECQTSQISTVSTESLKNIVTNCMDRVLDERIPHNLSESIEEIKVFQFKVVETKKGILEELLLLLLLIFVQKKYNPLSYRL